VVEKRETVKSLPSD